MNILVIAPHGDDEVLGCGGTIAKYAKQGHEVYILYVTKPYPPRWSIPYCNSRKKEIDKVQKVLKTAGYYNLDYAAAELDLIGEARIVEKIRAKTEMLQPDLLFMPNSGDMHIDHRITYEASVAASRPPNHRIKKILCYETLSQTEWGLTGFRPDVFIDITGTIYLKKKAMLCYKTETKKPFHPRSLSGIDALARMRGLTINVEYAEAFKLIREIID